jgi:serine/threonine-protein kinase
MRFLAWHPDGERVTFTGADGDLYWMPVDGSGEAQRLTAHDSDVRSEPQVRVPASWSPDGRTLLFTQRRGASLNRDIWTLTRGESRAVTKPLLATGADEPSADISPDGRYIAYESNLSGRSEIYVQRFSGTGRRELVSADGGVQPVWGRDGRALFYRAPGPARMMRMMVVDVRPEETLTFGPPRVLWDALSTRFPGGTGGRTFDISPDGRRFLMTLQRDPIPQPPVTHIVLVQHWFEELRRLVPGK